MKIVLFVSVLDQYGGAEIGTTRLAGALAERGQQVILLSTVRLRQWHSYRLFDYTKNYTLIRLPVWQRSPRVFRRMLYVQALWALPLLLRGAHVFHLRGLTPETVTLARIARHLGVKTLCVPMASGAYGDVATFPPDAPRHANAFDWISALTEPLRAEVIQWGFPATRTSIISNGVDTTLFKPPDQPHSVPGIIFVGQFRPEKRIDLLLAAWQRVVADYPQAKLTLVGGGRFLPDYRRRAAQLGLAPTFIPNTDGEGVLTHLQASTIFVQPGISEGMSNALLEAMAVGLAPIVSDTPANRAVITPEVDGLVYEADSADALAAQIKRLIADESLRRRLGAAARRTVLERFRLSGVTDQYLALYTQMLGEAP